MPHTAGELFSTIRRQIVREAADNARVQRGLREAVALQAGGLGEDPSNGMWDEQGVWQSYFLLGSTGFGQGGLA